MRLNLNANFKHSHKVSFTKLLLTRLHVIKKSLLIISVLKINFLQTLMMGQPKKYTNEEDKKAARAVCAREKRAAEYEEQKSKTTEKDVRVTKNTPCQ